LKLAALSCLVAAIAGASDWYGFRPANDTGPSVIGMEDWIEKPAGKAGRITRDGDRLLYGGKPVKLWGLNLCYGACAPDRALANKRAAFYPKYGINAVRLHKYADGAKGMGIQSSDSFLEFDSDALDRMDYQVAQFKKAGIYVLLSSTFGVKLGPADRKHVPYMDEFGESKGARVRTEHGSVFLSRELQDMQIQQVVKLLRHKNPHTGLTYAEDPAVAVIELFNEDSALFYGTMKQLQTVPTLRKRAGERFTDWLLKRYGSQEALLEAWGPDALDSFVNEGFTGESVKDKSIVPAGNPWFYDPDQLAATQAHKRQRMLDTMLFLYEIQNEFYARYVKAIRDAGYKGEILGSNWQAGRAMSHFYNLHSDALVGLIDRHGYFGGGGRNKPFNNATMLRVAGSEMLSLGLQQVSDRPFSISEWIHVYPNEWGVEGPAILGAYGYGLQGWDASFMFQNNDSGVFSTTIGRSPWDVMAPQILGVFPAVARQVLRGDVRESDLRATMRVHVPSLQSGKLGFNDRVRHEHDMKSFDCDKVPARALAVARCVVEFTGKYEDTPQIDLAPFQKDGALVSSTGQLRWREGGDQKHAGYFTMDTPGTKAVVGFAGGQTCRLGEVTIAPQSRFGAIYVTARDKNATIASGKELIVVAIARARNTGMTLNAEENQILEKGAAPVLMEPVKAAVTITGRAVKAVNALDHDGRRTGKTLPVQNGGFVIDGAKDQTPYYEIILN
jgi:hypothetical protein